jgi:hypothetical protein
VYENGENRWRASKVQLLAERDLTETAMVNYTRMLSTSRLTSFPQTMLPGVDEPLRFLHERSDLVRSLHKAVSGLRY